MPFEFVHRGERRLGNNGREVVGGKKTGHPDEAQTDADASRAEAASVRRLHDLLDLHTTDRASYRRAY